MIERYAPSGEFSQSILIRTMCFGALLGLLGYAYQFVVELIPLMYVNFLLTIGAATLAGMATAMVIKQSNCRNLVVALGVASLLALCTLAGGHFRSYQKWNNAIRQDYVENGEMTEEEASKEYMDFMTYVQMRAAIGWSVSKSSGKGLPIKGVFFYLVWLIEAGIFFYLCLTQARDTAKRPYCETCKKWTGDFSTVHHVMNVDDAEVARLSTADSLDTLLQPADTAGKPETSNVVSYYVANCPSCQVKAYLSLVMTNTKVNKKGEAKVTTKKLWEAVRLSVTDYDRLKKAVAQLQGNQATGESLGSAGA